MAELNLKQITDKLNTEFTGSVRQLIFWYDANAEFAGDIDTLELENAKVYKLEPDNQFYTKYFLECVDTETNYLIYAPFAKPSVRDNHLADTIHYSKEFFADRASLLILDLGIDERYKPMIQKYMKFFGSKERTQKFYDLELDTFNRSTIEIGLMSVLCKCKTASFEDVVRTVLFEKDWEHSVCLAELENYELLEAFWQQAGLTFGYNDAEPTVKKFAMTLFATYAAKVLGGDVPKNWMPFLSVKSGNVVAFLDNLMNSFLYGEPFDEVAQAVYDALGGDAALNTIPKDSLVSCNLFASTDRFIIRWVIDRLLTEDVSAKLGGNSIHEVCELRRKMHNGRKFEKEYHALRAALSILEAGQYLPVSGIDQLTKRYTDELYRIDRDYRRFYYYYDQLEAPEFERLRELVENIYTNDYLNKLIVNWNTEFTASEGISQTAKQTDFFSRKVRPAKERVVVIISDALRYEVGVSLFEKLQADAKCKASISVMQSTLPSYTRLGMAALLPHRELKLCEDGEALCDGEPTLNLAQREAILQKDSPRSRCVQFDDIKSMNQTGLREIFARQDVVYVYHNQIDARGDKPASENEVFVACEEAIEEIFALIKRLTTSANTVHFIVTADHGFIYKRDKLAESDKISKVNCSAGAREGGLGHGIPGAAKRYAVTADVLSSEGVCSVPLVNTIGSHNSDDTRRVYFPMGADLFKAAGSGLNYVHGGSSPQEMLIPVIDVHTEKAKRETTNAGIALVSLTNRITNLITTLDFVQTEALSDVVKEAQYKAGFVDGNGNSISNEVYYTADKKEKDAAKRMFRLKFSFRNQKYDTGRKYYLVVANADTGMEVLRHEVLMDLAFADDFGFDL